MTATAPHDPHYIPHSQGYNNRLSTYAATNSIPDASSRLAPSYSFPNNTPASVSRNSVHSSISRQLPPPPSMPTSQSTSALQGSRKRERRPDWDDFFKNGTPKEIIVIDDDSPPPPQKKENESATHTTRAAARGGAEHANKKRRTGHTSAYDSARDHYGSYSNTRTYSQGDIASNTTSTDRTTSLQTTAPTSLGSHTSHGSNPYLEDRAVGQKRKRVTRQQIADEKKRTEVDVLGDPNSLYVPPPKPPIKAKEVHVVQVRDVK